MKRYRAIYETTPSGGFDEFDALGDRTAMMQAQAKCAFYGRLVRLTCVSELPVRQVFP